MFLDPRARRIAISTFSVCFLGMISFGLIPPADDASAIGRFRGGRQGSMQSCSGSNCGQRVNVNVGRRVGVGVGNRNNNRDVNRSRDVDIDIDADRDADLANRLGELTLQAQVNASNQYSQQPPVYVPPPQQTPPPTTTTPLPTTTPEDEDQGRSDEWYENKIADLERRLTDLTNRVDNPSNEDVNKLAGKLPPMYFQVHDPRGQYTTQQQKAYLGEKVNIRLSPSPYIPTGLNQTPRQEREQLPAPTN